MDINQYLGKLLMSWPHGRTKLWGQWCKQVCVCVCVCVCVHVCGILRIHVVYASLVYIQIPLFPQCCKGILPTIADDAIHPALLNWRV